MTGQAVEEIKVQLDGRRHSFTCELVAFDRRGAIIAWRNPSTLELPLFTFPAGCVSHGFFWRRRRHNLYRFSDPSGEPLGFRLDVISPPAISRHRVVYTDLVLDIVQEPGMPPILEDEDELQVARAEGLISEDEARTALIYARRLLRRLPRVLVEAERWMSENAERSYSPAVSSAVAVDSSASSSSSSSSSTSISKSISISRSSRSNSSTG